MNVRIDRLRLQVQGMSPEAAREFGRLVAERLGELLDGAPPAAGAARSVSQHVSVPCPAHDSPGRLAAAVAAEIARTLRAGAAR